MYIYIKFILNIKFNVVLNIVSFVRRTLFN
jgi:hypothetical protein